MGWLGTVNYMLGDLSEQFFDGSLDTRFMFPFQGEEHSVAILGGLHARIGANGNLWKSVRDRFEWIGDRSLIAANIDPT